ncbi:MAG: potassium transporter TrkA, partial [Omnitrophica WOR_2 bacterium RIFOXYC2_FULL_38_12]
IGDEMDAVIVSLGKKIEESILITFYLKEMNIPRIIVKSINEVHGKLLSLIGASDIIYPEKSEAGRLVQKLTSRNLIEHIPLAEEHSIVQFEAPDSFIGKSLKELQLRNKHKVEVIAIKEVVTDKFYVVPEADFKIKPDSALILIGKDSDIAKLKFPKS